MRKLKLPGRDQTRARLDRNDIKLIKDRGIDSIKEDARDIIELKLREQPENDSKQTPRAGNPIYKAMHATNISSREQLFMAHRIPEEKRLTDSQIDSLVNLVMRWIVREFNFYQKEQKSHKNLDEF